MDMSATTTIGRSPREVFEYVSDISNDANWRSGVADSGLRSDGPVGLGSVGYAGSGSLKTVYRVTVYEPFERVDWEFIEGPIVGRGGYRLAAAGAGTCFALVADIQPSGVMRLLGPVFGWIGRRRNRSDVETLRRILESATVSSGSRSGAQPAD